MITKIVQAHLKLNYFEFSKSNEKCSDENNFGLLII